MADISREEPRSTLQALDVHADWIRRYRTSENDRYYRQSFDFVASILGPPGEDVVLDAGCGSGHKTLQLVRRGYKVLGLDFSQVMVEKAREAAREAGLADRAEFARGDLTSLTFASGSIKRAFCWGVLMHVPDVEKAVAELARVLAPGGLLIVSEANWRSLQARTLRLLSRVAGSGRARVTRTPLGIESWEDTPAGGLLTRQSDIPRLIAEFERHGLELQTRRAGQFSEIYTILPVKPLRRAVHGFNELWFRGIRAGGPAFANILVLRKR